MQADGRTDRQEAQPTNAYIITTSRDIEATRHGTVVWCGRNTRGRSELRWWWWWPLIKNAHLYMNIYQGVRKANGGWGGAGGVSGTQRRPSHIQSNSPPFACHFSITTFFTFRPRHFYFGAAGAGGAALKWPGGVDRRKSTICIYKYSTVDIRGTYNISGGMAATTTEPPPPMETRWNENRVKQAAASLCGWQIKIVNHKGIKL